VPSLTSKRLRRNLATGGTVCGLKGANVAAANNKSPLDDNTCPACGRLLATQCNTAPVASSERAPREWSTGLCGLHAPASLMGLVCSERACQLHGLTLISCV